MSTIHEVRVQVDEYGQPLGCTVIHSWGSEREQVEPVPFGPFDTAGEVAALGLARVDVQLTLW
jgi:hypothetical protein